MATFHDYAHGVTHLPESNGTMHEHTQVEFPPQTHLAGKGFHGAGHIAMPQHITGHRGTPRLRNTQPPASA